MQYIQRIFEVQRLAISIDTAWNFFSNPHNLAQITPPSLNFQVQSAPKGQIYPGMILVYRVTPLCNIPLSWVSEITQVIEGEFFIDEQRIGPYRLWHHEHRIKPFIGSNGTECSVVEDEIHYLLPYGPLGRALNHVLVRKQLEGIFSYRRTQLASLFGEAQ